MLLVYIFRCDFNGVMQANPVQLTENQKSMRAALNVRMEQVRYQNEDLCLQKCAGNQGNRRQDSSGETYCCRYCTVLYYTILYYTIQGTCRLQRGRGH